MRSVGGRAPLGGVDGAEQHHGRRPVGRGQVGDAGVPTDHQPGAGDEIAQRTEVGAAGQDAVHRQPGAAGDGHGEVALAAGAGDEDRSPRSVEGGGHGREPLDGPPLGPVGRAGVDEDRRRRTGRPAAGRCIVRRCRAGRRRVRRLGSPRPVLLDPGTFDSTSLVLACVRPAQAGDGRRRSSASAGIPTASSSAHHRARSCGWAAATVSQAGPSQPGPASPQRNPIRRRGFSALSARWLCGPVPCRLTATSGAVPGHGTAVGSGVGSSRSTPPMRSTSGASAALVASTRRCSGWARRSARSAGTATSRSPICRARRTRTVGRESSGRSSATGTPYPPCVRPTPRGRELIVRVLPLRQPDYPPDDQLVDVSADRPGRIGPVRAWIVAG